MTTTELINLALELGDMLLENGAETYRVEDSMQRICEAYGASADVFAVPTTIIITVKNKDMNPITQIRRIHSRGTNLHRVKELNDLSRNLCQHTYTYTEAMAQLRKIQSAPPYSQCIQILGFAFIGCFFTAIFGGTVTDSIASLIISGLTKIILDILNKVHTSEFFEDIICGALIAALAATSVHLGYASNLDKIIIGSIMGLVPGLAFTNSMRDIIAGDLMAGVTKVTEALLIGAGIAVGAAIPLTLLRSVWEV